MFLMLRSHLWHQQTTNATYWNWSAAAKPWRRMTLDSSQQLEISLLVTSPASTHLLPALGACKPITNACEFCPTGTCLHCLHETLSITTCNVTSARYCTIQQSTCTGRCPLVVLDHNIVVPLKRVRTVLVSDLSSQSSALWDLLRLTYKFMWRLCADLQLLPTQDFQKR